MNNKLKTIEQFKISLNLKDLPLYSKYDKEGVKSENLYYLNKEKKIEVIISRIIANKINCNKELLLKINHTIKSYDNGIYDCYLIEDTQPYNEQPLIEMKSLLEKQSNPTQHEKRFIINGSYFGCTKVVLFYLAIIFIIFHKTIIPKLTPISSLAHKLHEDSKYQFNGARCIDGWISESQGEGTCSSHSGVDFYFEKGEYSKSLDECFEEAKEISWFKYFD